jgi:hypothetical protein
VALGHVAAIGEEVVLLQPGHGVVLRRRRVVGVDHEAQPDELLADAVLLVGQHPAEQEDGQTRARESATERRLKASVPWSRTTTKAARRRKSNRAA